jgi:KUP system potassium uptake protein
MLFLFNHFGAIEISFLANVAKNKELDVLFFELFIFMVMYIWYYARKIQQSFHEV